ncbi:hypothetical protein GCM10023353_17010 [Tomitella cavernea]|uniref:Uncharacterized protein n=1 Tax=Tomitella cavernea TaxID=1387982 RepID=A0ABP9CJR2_9ACTN
MRVKYVTFAIVNNTAAAMCAPELRIAVETIPVAMTKAKAPRQGSLGAMSGSGEVSVDVGTRISLWASAWIGS